MSLQSEAMARRHVAGDWQRGIVLARADFKAAPTPRPQYQIMMEEGPVYGTWGEYYGEAARRANA